MRAADGAVLDPDDHFNQVSGANVLCTFCASNSANVNIAGSDLLVTWAQPSLPRATQLHAVRVSSATGERIGAVTTTSEAQVGPISGFPTFYARGDWGLALDQQVDVTAVDIAASPLGLSITKQSPLRQFSESRGNPIVASNGQGFAVVWRVEENVWVTRIDPDAKTYLDTASLAVGSGTAATIASDGTDYLVAWVNTAKTLERRFLRADGTLEAALSPLPAMATSQLPSGSATALRLIHNGKCFLLTWLRQGGGADVNAYRLDGQGAPVDATYVTLISNGTRLYSTAADTAPADAIRTFVAVDSLSNNVQTRRFRSESGALITPLTTLGSGAEPFLASDGTRIFATYWNGPQWGTLIDPISGTSLAGFPVALTEPISFARTKVAWYDGKSFSVIFAESVDYFARRYDSQLTPLEPATPARGSFVAGTFFPDNLLLQQSVASDGKGRSVFAYLMSDAARMGIAVKVKVLDNDGVREPPDGGSGDAAVGVDSGSNGAGGSGGIGGNDAATDASDGAPADAATGGTSGSGGVSGSGGTTSDAASGGSGGGAGAGAGAAGDSSGSGGASGSAGHAGTTGGTGSAGVSGSGGTTGSGTGGVGGQSGSASGPSQSGSQPAEESGCGCKIPGSPSPRQQHCRALLFLFALGLYRRRRGTCAHRALSDTRTCAPCLYKESLGKCAVSLD